MCVYVRHLDVRQLPSGDLLDVFQRHAAVDDPPLDRLELRDILRHVDDRHVARWYDDMVPEPDVDKDRFFHKNPRRWTYCSVKVDAIDAEPLTNLPLDCWGSRRPTDMAASQAPSHPDRSPNGPRNPDPAVFGIVGPAPVVVGCPSPLLVRGPEPAVVVGPRSVPIV
jgi:hypothetical protein